MSTQGARPAYQRSLELHRRIEALYKKFEGAYFRVPRPVDGCFRIPHSQHRPHIGTDPIVGALAIKAATTKQAVVTLCEANDGDNALALTRVLLENACLLEWLIRDEYRTRLEAYWMFTDVMAQRITDTIDRFAKRFKAAGANPTFKVSAYQQMIAEHIFGNPRHDRPTWNFDRNTGQGKKVKVYELFDEIAGGKNLSFEYAVLYGAIGSDIVHSGPLSLTRTLDATLTKSKLWIGPLPIPFGTVIALAVSNIAMLLVLDSVNQYAHLDLTEEIESIKTEAQKNPEQEDDEE